MTNKTNAFSCSRNREHDTQEKDILYITHNEKTFAYKEPETILETLERNKINADFNCREGFCGVCRTKLLSGQVEYIVDPLAFIDDDEILTCCTAPIGDIELKTEY